MTVRADFFQGASRRLYGVLHPPGNIDVSSSTAVIFVHPFMEERQDAHPFLRSLAGVAAERGAWAFRFDLHGCGDSEGEWSDATVESWREDVSAATAFVRAETGATRVVLAGLRFGAAIAATSAEAAASPLALIQPAVKGATYAMDMLRAYLAAEMVLTKRTGATRDALIERLGRGENVNVFGYALTPAQFEGMRSIDLSVSLAAHAQPVLVVDLVKTETARASNEFAKLAEAIGPSATLVRAVEPQPLHAEGKVHLTRAPNVERVFGDWLDSLARP